MCKIMIFNVLGGHDGRQSLRSTELITINPPSTRYGPTLPKGLYSHCSVIIRDKIFVIGGRNSNGHGFKETLMIDVATREITNGPDMHFARKYHACTSYMNEKGENGILVVGGHNWDDDNAISTTEILKVHGGQLSWTRGLP